MRSYNFVFVVTPDFEDFQLRVRAMDFDQQSYNGRRNFYRPQFFKENAALALFCSKHLRIETAAQYLREEQTLMLQRAELAASRLGLLLAQMERDPISPPEKVRMLGESLAEHYGRPEYLRCESMGALVRQNLEVNPPTCRPTGDDRARPQSSMNSFPRRLFLPAFLALLGLVAGCDTQPNRQPRSTRTVELAPGAPAPDLEVGLVSAVRFVLPGPEPGSGLSWEIASNNGKVLDPMGPLAPVAGTPTSAVSFYTLRPGKSVVRFVLVKPAEAETIPAASCKVTVRVSE